jgi:peptide subunit release factor RF-3
VNTYLNWKRSKVSWQAIDANHTKVTWEIDYERKLDPAWYFGTLEHFTVYLMAHALVDYAATPQEKAKNKGLAAL